MRYIFIFVEFCTQNIVIFLKLVKIKMKKFLGIFVVEKIKI